MGAEGLYVLINTYFVSATRAVSRVKSKNPEPESLILNSVQVFILLHHHSTTHPVVRVSTPFVLLFYHHEPFWFHVPLLPRKPTDVRIRTLH